MLSFFESFSSSVPILAKYVFKFLPLTLFSAILDRPIVVRNTQVDNSWLL